MAEDTLSIRVTLPDRWRERKMEFSSETPVGVIKEQALPLLLGKSDVDSGAYYVEYFEKEVRDESRTLADLNITSGAVILLRPYDLDHPPPFRG